jgi:hypothetical protein
MMKGNTICPQPFHGGGIKMLMSNPDNKNFKFKRTEFPY